MNQSGPIPEAVRASLQSSGFPFQTAVAHVVNPSLGWTLHASEYPWHGQEDDPHFLDIVATNGTIFLTIECMKTRKEILTFLRPLSLANTGEVDQFRCLRAKQIADATKRVELFCEEWAVNPRSTCSEFCVVSTSDSGKDQRLLEKDARVLVQATDAFAEDYRERVRPDQGPSPSSTCLFLPVIVTNAPIYTARYKPTDISLESGEFFVPPTDILAVRWVRFRRAFTSVVQADLGDRSVFVVQAMFFRDFLRDIQPAPSQPADHVAVQLPKRRKG